MSDYDQICYENTFLKQVIVRIDFSVPQSNDHMFNEKVLTTIKQKFSTPEKEQIVFYGQLEVDIESGVVKDSSSQRTMQGRQLTFLDKSLRNKVIISNTYLVLEYNAYTTFEDLLDSAKLLVKETFGRDDINIARIGLRYINLFSHTSGQKITKTMYTRSISNNFNDNPLQLSDQFSPIRSITTTEYKYGNIRINYRSGIYNRRYPDIMTADDYLIDIDCFQIGNIMNAGEAEAFLLDAHKAVQEMFERSISDSLRAVMKHE